jgi:pimeloyl-ACP methyl ester carboxylesterase
VAPVLDVALPGEIAAWHYAPEQATACVVMAHGFSAVREQALPSFAEQIAAAGIAVVLFDYRGFGASGGELRQVMDIGAQLDDWRTAIAWARERYAQVGLFGSSFAGGHVIGLGASEPGIAAIVAQCPLTDGPASALLMPKGTATRLSRIAVQDALGARVGRRPRLVPAVGRPGELAFLTSPDSASGFAEMTPPESNWRNLIAARIGLQTLRYRPGAKAAEIPCPILLCVCEHDRLCAPKPAMKVAEKAPQGELVRYPVGHFALYQGEWFERAVTRQVEFLARHLVTSG